MEARKKELKQAHDALYAPKQEKAKREEVNPFATGIEHNLLHQANGRASMVMKVCHGAHVLGCRLTISRGSRENCPLTR